MGTPNYGWDHIASNQASKEVTANGVFDDIDAEVKVLADAISALSGSSGGSGSLLNAKHEARMLFYAHYTSDFGQANAPISFGDEMLDVTTGAFGAAVPTADHGNAYELQANNSVVDVRGLTAWRYGKNLQAFFALYIDALTSVRLFLGYTDGGSVATLMGNDSPAAVGQKFCGFRFSSNASDTNYQCITSDGSTDTKTDSGVVADVKEHRFVIICNDTVPNVKFYIDDVLVATHTTHLPASGTNQQYMAGLKALAAANKKLGLAEIRLQSDW